MENDKEIIIKKYLSAFEPVAHSGESECLMCNVYALQSGESRVERGEFSWRVVVKTSEDIIRELADIVELEINDVVAVMLAEGYDLMRRNEVFGWGLVAKRPEHV